MAISAGQLLTPPFHGVYTTVPLKTMLNWHNGKPDPADTNREWVVEDLPGCKGRGYMKLVCREYTLHRYRPPRPKHLQGGHLQALRAREMERRRRGGIFA